PTSVFRFITGINTKTNGDIAITPINNALRFSSPRANAKDVTRKQIPMQNRYLESFLEIKISILFIFH
ncbi:hypothetical protein, partial [Bacteroides acidifaciens]|uniref:hypothetical protein n=1 Tax=Bacteroides acidifaciens TaxID=85831 RepID=UPI002430A6F7